MKNIYLIVMLHLISLIQLDVAAQGKHNGDHVIKGAHLLTLGMSHIHISQVKIDGDTKWFATPA